MLIIISANFFIVRSSFRFHIAIVCILHTHITIIVKFLEYARLSIHLSTMWIQLKWRYVEQWTSTNSVCLKNQMKSFPTKMENFMHLIKNTHRHWLTWIITRQTKFKSSLSYIHILYKSLSNIHCLWKFTIHIKGILR